MEEPIVATLPMGVDYTRAVTPAAYICANCGATNCKLWRKNGHQVPQLSCATCAGRNQKVDISSIAADGTIETDMRARTDHIGEYVPAVPKEEGTGYWGYNYPPRDGIVWWEHLPTLPS